MCSNVQCFFHTKIPLSTADNKQCAATRGLARKKGRGKETQMLEWLKSILADSYTEEIDKQISQEIGKNFVSKADFNTGGKLQ